MIQTHIGSIIVLILAGIGLLSLSGLYMLARDDQDNDDLHDRFDVMSNLTCSFGLSAWAVIGLGLLNPMINLDVSAVGYMLLLISFSMVQLFRDAKHFD